MKLNKPVSFVYCGLVAGMILPNLSDQYIHENRANYLIKKESFQLSNNKNNVSKESSQTLTSANSESTQKDFVYLSDIPYVANQSSAGWKQITMDKTTDNTSLSLRINGNPFAFEKGVFAHAKSTVVYDLTNYQNYTYFTTWYGVSSHMGGNGSVKFYIYTSEDGKNWDLETEENPEEMRGNSNAKFVKIDIRGKKYLKLYADPNGGNGQDHSLYADAKFITNDYTENVTSTVEEYDELLKKYEGQPIQGEYEFLLLKREFVSKAGQFILNSYANESDEYKETLKWLMGDFDTLNMYMMGGAPDGGYYNSLKELSRLYHAFKDDFTITEKTRTGKITYGELYKKMAISLSLTHSTKVYLWMQANKSVNVSDSVERYKIFKQLHKNDQFKVSDRLDQTPIFETLEIEEMRYVLNNIIDDESIVWLNEYTQQYIDANPGKEQVYLQPHYYMNYIWPNYSRPELHDEKNKDYYNIKYGVYKKGQDLSSLKGGHAQWKTGLDYKLPEGEENRVNGIFSHYNVTWNPGTYKLWMNIEAGAVCGGISKIGSNIRGVHGMPSSVISQPGHAALIYYQQNSEGKGYWSIDNNVSGWAMSGKTERLSIRMPLGWGNDSYVNGWAASYIVLAQEAINDFEKYEQAEKLIMLANVYKNDAVKYEYYLREALKVESINVDAWWELIKLYQGDKTKTEEDYYRLAEEIGEALKDFPLPMYNLMNLLKTNLNSKEYDFKFTILQTRLLNEGATANSETSSVLQPSITNTVAKYLLGQVDTELASFSFDGENAGKIVLSDRFNDAGIRIDYSLNKGEKWTEVYFDANGEHKISLTQEEIESITAENDIWVHIVGTGYEDEDIFKIDITQATLPSTISSNDLENRVMGVTNVYEWRYVTLSGEESQNYTPWEKIDVTNRTVTPTSEWTSYEKENPRFTGAKYVEVRIRATGTHTPSNTAVYKFTDDNQSRGRTYILIENLSVLRASSEATGNQGHKENAIDGLMSTRWHSNYSGGDSQRFIDIEVKPNADGSLRYISGLQYVPVQSGNGNGRIRHGKMYVSNDGENWTEVADFNSGNGSANTEITLKESVQAKYVRLQAITNWGDGRNFITAVMINLFEDLDGERPRAQVEYSTKDVTTEAVDVTLTPTKKVKITDAAGVPYTEKENGDFVFEVKENKEFKVTFEDENGKPGYADIAVNWIVDYDFSFNGDNAGKISIGEKFLTENGKIKWEYSIKGGEAGSWVTVEDLSHELSQEEIAEMSATNGLQLRITLLEFNKDAIKDNEDLILNEDGSVSVNIEVTAGSSIPNELLYANDLENKIIGVTDDMEWRYVDFDDEGLSVNIDNSISNLDGVAIMPTSEWKSFTQENPTISGEKKIEVRYMAHDRILPGTSKIFKFTTVEKDENHTYIPTKYYTVSDYSSETNRPGNYEVVGNAIDGNKFTAWVTNRGEKVNGVDKYITIELDKPRHLTKLEAIGKENFQYGNIKDGSVWVSMDGENWEKVAECHDGRFTNASEMLGASAINKLDRNTIDKNNPRVNVKVFEFEPVYAKYIKLQNDKSHDYVSGLVDGKDRDFFLNLTMLNLYEDTKTVAEEPVVLIDYSIKGITNQDVTATIYSPNANIDVISEGGAEHKFEENGEWTFKYKILNSNGEVIKIDTMKAVVDGIDKVAPKVQVVFNEMNKTQGNVNATLIFDEEVTIESDDLEIVDDSAGYKMLVFRENGTKILKFRDLVGNQTVVPIEVTWIDREAPIADVTYTPSTSTNDKVEVTLNFNEKTILECRDFDIKKISDTSYTFTVTENINHNIVFEDEAGNKGTANVVVDWIDKVAPTGEIIYSDTNPTAEPVIATLKTDEDVVITNNDGKNAYLFIENGTFTFEFVDKAGNKGSATATVDWIDSKIPHLDVQYSTKEITNQNVTVKLLTGDKNITITNNEGSDTVVFEENGTFTFEYEDEEGNKGKTKVVVDWIDKVIPTATVEYSTKDFTNQNVTATITPSEEVVITNNDGKNTYTFTENDSFTFEFIDKAGNIGTATAKVDWINKTDPELKVTYDITEDTTGPVTATLELSDGITIDNNDGKNTYTFTQNGTFTFKYTDKYGNSGMTTAVVNWIIKDDLKVEMSYSTTTLTNQDVTATIKSNKNITITNNDGNASYVFKENGTFTFGYVDEKGNKGTITATVDWIDKVAPTAEIKYSTTDLTNKDVVATLVNPSEKITVKDLTDGTFTFTENGSYTFVFEDEAGNVVEIVATVDWIDKEAPIVHIEYSDINPTDEPVIATIKANEDIIITNNGGAYSYIFTENGTFTFEYVDKAGNVGTIVATVDWIDNTAPVGEIIYSDTSSTTGPVIATLKTDEDVVITNNDGKNAYIFIENGTFTFEFVNRAGIKGTATAVVTWITPKTEEPVAPVKPATPTTPNNHKNETNNSEKPNSSQKPNNETPDDKDDNSSTDVSQSTEENEEKTDNKEKIIYLIIGLSLVISSIMLLFKYKNRDSNDD